MSRSVSRVSRTGTRDTRTLCQRSPRKPPHSPAENGEANTARGGSIPGVSWLVVAQQEECLLHPSRQLVEDQRKLGVRVIRFD